METNFIYTIYRRMALPNNTFASPGNPYFALKGEIVGAQEWYQYPSQNGEVLLNDASGTQVLQSISGNLYYNNELLAKANDISDIAAWSDYPVLNPGGVNFNGNPLINASTISATGDISSNGDVHSSSLFVTAGIETGASGIFTSFLSTNGGVGVNGNVKTATVSATGNVAAGSLTTTGGLDMTNSGVTRASSVGISNAGFAPYGTLTSPDGVQLTWNGAAITTGGAGNVSQWANFPAVAAIQGNGQSISNVTTISTTSTITSGNNLVASSFPTSAVISNNYLQAVDASNTPLRIAAANASGLLINSPNGGVATTAAAGNIESSASGNIVNTSTGGNVTTTAYNSVAINSGNDIALTADAGINPLYTSTVNLTAQNGNGGQVNITANPGAVAAFGGKVSIVANGGTIVLPTNPPTSVTVGGEVDIFANTGAGGLYTLTSAVKIAAAGVNSYAGAIPAIGSLAGYNFIYGTGGVSVCAGLPASGVQFPGTTYIYGVGIPGVAGGVRLQSPQGIQMLSDTYIQNLYPLDGNGLTIQGRSLPTGYVTVKDVAQLTMNPATAVQTDRVTSVSNLGILFQDAIQATTLQPPAATGAGTPPLVIRGNSSVIPGLYNNYVQIQNANTIAFDVSGSGALTGVQSINGASWPPATGDASLWSQYPATSTIDASGYGIVNLSTINGQAYTPTSQWSTFNAVSSVDLSSNGIVNVASINVLDNATIISAGSLGIFTDGKDLTLASDNSGNVNIGTGNKGDISIITSGAGNNLTLTGDTVAINGTVGVQVSAPYLDMTGNNINNVNQLLGAGDGTDLVISNPGTGTVSILDQSGSITLSSQYNGLVFAAGTDINMTSVSGSIKQNAPVIVGQIGFPKNLTVNGNAYATSDVVSSYGGATPYSLNTIGGLVAGTSSRFRDATEFYVSSDGSDTSGNGSILAPYLTIQYAITQAELISSAALVCVINVASGHYTENLTFTRGYVTLNGSLQSQTGNEVCEITGSMSIALTGASDLFNRQVSFQGFNITCGAGQAITDTSTTPHIVSFQDCKCFVNNQLFVSTSSATDMRLYMTNVEIQQTNAAATPSLAVIVTNIGQIELERVDVTLAGNISAVSIGGTSVLSRFSLSTLDATSAATTLIPPLSITSTTTATHSLGNVAFAFTSAVVKTASNAINIASGINTAILMFNCTFTLAGTASSTNYCVGYNGVGSPTIAGVNNTSLSVNVLLPQTTTVQTGIAQVSYIDINPPGLACYSSTADQAIAVSGTPQALTYNTTQFNQGTTLVANSRVYANAQGNYALSYSVELQHAGGGAVQIATTFLKKNGTTIANTGRQWSITSASFQNAATAEFVVALNAGDYVEVFFNGDTSLSANATAAAGALPAIPSVVFNIKQFR